MDAADVEPAPLSGAFFFIDAFFDVFTFDYVCYLVIRPTKQHNIRQDSATRTTVCYVT